MLSLRAVLRQVPARLTSQRLLVARAASTWAEVPQGPPVRTLWRIEPVFLSLTRLEGCRCLRPDYRHALPLLIFGERQGYSRYLCPSLLVYSMLNHHARYHWSFQGRQFSRENQSRRWRIPLVFTFHLSSLTTLIDFISRRWQGEALRSTISARSREGHHWISSRQGICWNYRRSCIHQGRCPTRIWRWFWCH